MKKLIITILLTINLFARISVSLQTDTSIINGTSKEIVYSGTKVLSELTWRLENTLLAGAKAQINITPSLYLYYSVYKNILYQTSTMDDYDWLSSTTTEWTHHSNHPNTVVDSVLLEDMGISLRSLKFNHLSLYLDYGKKIDYFKWYSLGGTYVYSDSDGSHFREYTGSFGADQLGITYEQKFLSYYLGLDLVYLAKNFEIQAKVAQAISSQTIDSDTHHLRSLYFTETFTGNALQFIQINLDYKLTQQWTLTSGLHYTKYNLLIGDTYVYDLSTQEYLGAYQNSAGISHSSYEFLLGLRYQL